MPFPKPLTGQSGAFDHARIGLPLCVRCVSGDIKIPSGVGRDNGREVVQVERTVLLRDPLLCEWLNR